jgi:uncharacterized repeat protein (TIGR04076 family)
VLAGEGEETGVTKSSAEVKIMAKDPRIEALAVESNCNRIKEGDRMVFNGPILDLKETTIACCTALTAMYPLVCALRFGMEPSNWGNPDKIVTQCPDRESSVTFELRRID